MLVSLTRQLDDAGYQKSHLLISSVARVHSTRRNLCHPTSYFPAVSFHLKPALLLTSSSHQIDRNKKAHKKASSLMSDGFLFVSCVHHFAQLALVLVALEQYLHSNVRGTNKVSYNVVQMAPQAFFR